MLRFIAALTLAVSALSAQSFEVASVRKSSHGETVGVTVLDLQRPIALGRVEYYKVTLKTILMAAYSVGKDQINGPPWISSEYYDIVAKLPEGALSDQVPAMLRNLLAERFHMTIREETIPRKGFALTADKGGPKLNAAKVGGKPGLELGVDHIQFTNCTVAEFAYVLSVIIGRPVADLTEIRGSYDVTLSASRVDLKAAGSAGDRSSGAVPRALRELGLRLESRYVPSPSIVVEKAEKTPTEN